MKTYKRNQKLLLSGLLLGFLSLNISWNDFLNIKSVLTSELASTSTLCDPNKATGPMKMAARILGGDQKPIKYGKDPVVYGKPFMSLTTETTRDCPPGAGIWCNDKEKVKMSRSVYRVTIDLAKTNKFTSTEGDHDWVCAECDENIVHRVEISFPKIADTESNANGKNIAKLCSEIQDKVPDAYEQLVEDGTIYNAAKREAAQKAVAARLHELQDKCLVKGSADADEVLEMVSWNKDKAMEQLDTIESIDITGDYEDGDLGDIVEEFALGTHGERMSCHKTNMRSLKTRKARDKYMVKSGLLDDLRDRMLSDDEDIRQSAIDSLDSLQKQKAGLTERMRVYLGYMEFRGRKTQDYHSAIARLDEDYQEMKDRSNDPDWQRFADASYQNARLDIEKQYNSDIMGSVPNTFIVAGENIGGANRKFWRSHLEGIRHENNELISERDPSRSYRRDLPADFDIAMAREYRSQRGPDITRGLYDGNQVSLNIQRIMDDLSKAYCDIIPTVDCGNRLNAGAYNHSVGTRSNTRQGPPSSFANAARRGQLLRN